MKCPVCGNEDENYISYINKRPYCRKCIAFGRTYLDEVYPIHKTPLIMTDAGSLTVVFIFSLTKSLKTLIISMLLSFFIVKFVKIYVLTWANVCYNRHRR